VLTWTPHSRQDLRAIPDLPVRSPQEECNLKEVALKETIRSIDPREEDAQGTAAGHSGQEHAPAARRARAEPRRAVEAAQGRLRGAAIWFRAPASAIEASPDVAVGKVGGS
jgi:hypothetical protein